MGSVAHDDVGVVPVLVHDPHGRLLPSDAVGRAGVADSKTGNVVVDQGAAGAARLLVVDVKVGVQEVKDAIVVTPDLVVVGVQVDVMLPGLVFRQDRISLEHHRAVHGPGDVLDLLDQAGVEEVLRRVADVQFGRVEGSHGTGPGAGRASP